MLPTATTGRRTVGFAGRFRLELDLSEPLQRDFLAGVYDYTELRIVRRLLRPGGDFVDVGAHIGMYSVAAACALAGRGRVLAIEPHPESRKRLEANLALNGCENVVVVGCAASAAEGPATLVLAQPGGDASWSTLEASRLDGGETVGVETTTVDREVERLGLAPRVVKIDVEGHELSVLAGMQRTLARHRPAVLCEVGPATSAELSERLGDAGYRGFRVGIRRLLPLESASGMFNALFAPEER
jgi:FkbM family methyltransferase